MSSDRDSLRKLEILGTSGAAILGAGVGLLLARWLAPIALPLFLVGLVVHSWAMYARHRLESRGGVVRAWWEIGAYWICWLALAGLLIYAFVA